MAKQLEHDRLIGLKRFTNPNKPIFGKAEIKELSEQVAALENALINEDDWKDYVENSHKYEIPDLIRIMNRAKFRIHQLMTELEKSKGGQAHV